ncbi:SRPBCC domain-containing protein [Agromyces bracchium]|uniref:ATPase n=1 Tax=Agromyces bracchium TaxID=88376 RepID=A0A6I3M6Y5_9MICO|nr:SRPBCC domain-containing protein [Agromyces bracchium]MTH67932.1 ATPase [Agromyces bracchium]
MLEDLVVTSTVEIDASAERVWAVVTDPEAAREYLFGTNLDADWTVGGALRWSGEWQGRPYEDHGTVLEIDPPRRLVHTHFSPRRTSGLEPDDHHTLTWTLEGSSDGPTTLSLSQDNNATPESAAHAKGVWDSLVAKVKEIAERA